MQTADTRAIGYEALVNYAGFDGFKIACQEGGRPTASNLLSKGFRELSWSRGESGLYYADTSAFFRGSGSIWPTWKKAWYKAHPGGTNGGIGSGGCY